MEKSVFVIFPDFSIFFSQDLDGLRALDESRICGIDIGMDFFFFFFLKKNIFFKI